MWTWSAKVHVLIVARPSTFSISQTPSDQDLQIPCSPCGMRSEPKLPQSDLQCWGGSYLSPWVLFSHWRNWKFRKAFSCAFLGERLCFSYPSGLCGTRGASDWTPCSRVLSLSYSWIDIDCSYGGARSGMTYTALLVLSLSKVPYFSVFHG